MNDREKLAAMATRELAAYRNVLLMGRRCLQVGDFARRARHLVITESLLSERGVAFERGKLLTMKGRYS
jgi:hypothetical protein